MQLSSHNRRARTRRMAAILLLGLALISQATAAKEIKCWTGEDGVKQCGESFPSDLIDRGGTVFNERGIEVRKVPPTQTREEREQDEARARAQAAEQRHRTAQQAADRTLVLTYPTVADLLGARDRDLATIDAIIRTIRGNIRIQEDAVRRLRAAAADLERSGKTTPAHLTEGIGRAERAIRDYHASIQDREHQQEEIRRAFDLKLQRFRQLKDLAQAAAPSDQISRTQ